MDLQTESSRQVYRRQRKEYKDKAKELDQKVAEKRFAMREAFKGVHQPQGRRKKYTPITLKNRIIDYFSMMMALDRPPTKSGLMVHLKMCRDQYYQYEQYPEFANIMDQTSLIIENWAEERLVMGKYNPTGLVFMMKNRFGWKDTQTVETRNITPIEQLEARIAALAPNLISYLGGTSNVIDAVIEERNSSNSEESVEVDAIDFKKYKEARKAKMTYEEYLKKEEHRTSEENSTGGRINV